jgi:hypothetical protein
MQPQQNDFRAKEKPDGWPPQAAIGDGNLRKDKGWRVSKLAFITLSVLSLSKER